MGSIHVLLLSGGGWHGAVQCPILTGLHDEGRSYHLRLGVSVGSVNGATDACGIFDSVAMPLWDGLDDRTPLDGIRGFLAPAYFGGRGLFKFSPIRKLLEKHVPANGSKLKSAFGAGYVVRETGAYETALFLPPTEFDPVMAGLIRSAFGATRLGLHDAIIASAAIAGIVEPILAPGRTCADGGHVHVLPRIPDVLLPHIGRIDAVFCKPVTHWDRQPTTDVDGLIEALGWAVDMQMEAPRLADYTWLRSVKSRFPTMDVRVFAPTSVHGGMLDAKRSDIYDRYQLGKAAWANPVTL
jgi:hypothetical protein